VFLFHHGNPHPAKPVISHCPVCGDDGGNSVGMTSTQSRAGGLEIRSIDYVPLSERHGKVWHLGPLWFMSNAQIATLAVGLISISEGASLFWSVLAIVVGVLVGTLFMAFHSAQGPQLGLPQMIQSRPQFGYIGALLVWLFAYVQYAGFNVFNTILGGEAVLHPLPGGHVRRRHVQGERVPRPVRRGRRLPDQLGDLRLGLLPVHAAGRDRAQDLLLDLLGVGDRRRLDDDRRGGAGRLGGQELRRHRHRRAEPGRGTTCSPASAPSC
jgi:Permease for cytosine/purines, uracil, thiamine, allantoin